jgi:hypothetical protein
MYIQIPPKPTTTNNQQSERRRKISRFQVDVRDPVHEAREENNETHDLPTSQGHVIKSKRLIDYLRFQTKET